MTYPSIPTRRMFNEILEDPLYKDLRRYSKTFVDRYSDIYRKRYGWSTDPISHWSRRIEYPFVMSNILAKAGAAEMSILDAGSGFTFFPFYLDEHLNAEVTCVDQDPDLDGYFHQIPSDRVRFIQAGLDDLSIFPSCKFDIVYCISVLEHCAKRESIIQEVHRVLKENGSFILTLDLSLDGKSEISIETFRALVKTLSKYFTFSSNPEEELRNIDNDSKLILSTSSVRDLDPTSLPWKMSFRSVLGDVLRMRFPRRTFRNLTVYLEHLQKKSTTP